jgi:hypothetical protein
VTAFPLESSEAAAHCFPTEAAMRKLDPSTEASACDRASGCAREALRLAEAVVQIEELVDANRRLRSELSEMTLMWVNATSARNEKLTEVSGHFAQDAPNRPR